MAKGQSAVLRQLGSLFATGSVAGVPDHQLLERFVVRRDEFAEAAFAALVARHGPMVLKLCRNILRNTHDADDAFQATFLLLATKAARIGNRELLANSLHGVAVRTAMKARTRAARRLRHERRVAERSSGSFATLERDFELPCRFTPGYRRPAREIPLHGHSLPSRRDDPRTSLRGCSVAPSAPSAFG